jgi:mono/diheme cytochrome c family protein
MKSIPRTLATGLAILSWFAVAAAAEAADMDAMKAPAPPAPIRVTMSELHARGGVPRGWKFLIPPGDPTEGRKVFVSLECFACHEVKGEDFPSDAKTARGVGPALTGMGAHHPAEYFAESIVNPNRVIVVGTGYTGADGLSKMPSYAETVTLKQLIDVVAYLKSLTGKGMDHNKTSPSDSGKDHDKTHMGGSGMPEGGMKTK